MDEQEPRAWERRPGERHLWFSRFERFRLLGPTRSLRAAHNQERVARGLKESQQAPGSWRNAAAKWQWHARAEAWDQAERERQEQEWQARQTAIREADFSQGSRLRALAQEILAQGPKFVKTTRKRVSKGRPRTVDAEGKVLDPGEPEEIVVTLALDGDMAAKFVKLGSDLQRLAAEMVAPKQQVEVTGPEGQPIQFIEVVRPGDGGA